MLLQTIRIELWIQSLVNFIRNELMIQSLVAIFAFAIGIIVLKLYIKHILKLETSRNEISLTSRKNSSSMKLIGINLIWLLSERFPLSPI